MAIIKELSSHLADLIAAGEVAPGFGCKGAGRECDRRRLKPHYS